MKEIARFEYDPVISQTSKKQTRERVETDVKDRSQEEIQEFIGFKNKDIDLSNITEENIQNAIRCNDIELIKEVLTGERITQVTQRVGQDVIRKQALIQYSTECALCDIKDRDMLTASHVVPWSEDVQFRGILENVICLCKFHDTLFEKGKIAIMDDYSIKFSKSYLHMANESKSYVLLKKLTYKHLRLPISEHPSQELLCRRRESFLKNELYH